MVDWRLVVEAAFAVAAGSLFLFTGRVQLQREAVGDARRALQLFGTWWISLGLLTLAGGVMGALAHAGVTDLALWQVWTYIVFGALCVALWGLLYYLVYLFTGNSKWLPTLSIFYVAVFLFLLYFVNVGQPVGVELTKWSAQLEYANQPSGAMTAVLLLVIVLPQIVAGLAYFTLFFRVHERQQRFRIALVSWSIVVWFATGLVASVADLQQNDVYHVVQRLIGMTAAGLVVMAYRPPSRVQKWLAEGTQEAPGKVTKPAGPAGLKKTGPLASFA